MKSVRCSTIVLAAGCVVVVVVMALAGGVFIWAFDEILRSQVVKNVQLREGGFTYDIWKDVPVEFHMSVYVWDITNPRQVVRGDKPKLVQRGPFVYREYRKKANITFNENGTVSYREYRHYRFSRERSVASDDFVFTTINVPVLGAAVSVENAPGFVKFMMDTAFNLLGAEPLIQLRVRDLLWGYSDPFIDFVHNNFPSILPKNKFGFFMDYNNSNNGLFTAHTGVSDISQAHVLVNWNGMEELSYWGTEAANMINGTQGQMWPPFHDPKLPLRFFSPEACRSLQMEPVGKGSSLGIPVVRFMAPSWLFANGSDHADNAGFYSSAFISHPHFYNGDASLRDGVTGLDPVADLHEMFIDLHPLTGVPVNVSIRLQLNMMVKGVEGISTSGNIKPVILPILWFEESGHMDGELRDTFWTNVVLLPLIMDVVRYGLLGLGLALALGGAVALAVTRSRRRTDDNDDENEKGEKGEAVKTTPTTKKTKGRLNNNTKEYREVSGGTAPPPEKITKL
ncbi:unnamed protein product [Lampetra fluviatilis]